MILVTGGAGYIGSHTVKRLFARGNEIIVLDNLSEGHREAVGDAKLAIADLRDRDAVEKLFDEHEIEAVCHFANVCKVAESVEKPELYVDVNLTGGMNLLAAMRRHGVRRMIFSSSAAVYGCPEKQPIPENVPRQPVNPYGFSKVLYEDACEFAAREWGFLITSLRYFNAAGASPDGTIGESHDPETHLIPIALGVAAGKREQIRIFGTDYETSDKSCEREFVHIDDIAEAHVLALEKLGEKPGYRAYNIGAGIVSSVKEVIDTARKVTGKDIKSIEAQRRPGDPPVLEADSSQIRVELGWKPSYTSLEEIIETAWRWVQAPRF
ncbi:MAG: UDP-glucose 4-epimerase GalE [Planctomycetota bacterium]|jgi:UDP-glucose 4-epimerase